MSRDVLIRADLVMFIDRGESDVTGLPDGASIICETDWRLLVGEPLEGETFEQREAAYITSLGWVLAQ